MDSSGAPTHETEPSGSSFKLQLLHLHGIARRLGQFRPQVDRGGGRNCAQADHEAPAVVELVDVGTDAVLEDGQHRHSHGGGGEDAEACKAARERQAGGKQSGADVGVDGGREQSHTLAPRPSLLRAASKAPTLHGEDPR